MIAKPIKINDNQVYVINIPESPSEGEMTIQDTIILSLYSKLNSIKTEVDENQNPCKEVIGNIRGECNVGKPNWDDIYNDIIRTIKEGVLDICPNCDTVTNITPNPMYYHECEHCGWTGTYTDCKSSTPKERIKTLLNF